MFDERIFEFVSFYSANAALPACLENIYGSISNKVSRLYGVVVKCVLLRLLLLQLFPPAVAFPLLYLEGLTTSD